MDHAILSPSGSGRWLKCSRSARLELQFPDQESDFAKEGTLAHEIAERLLKSGEYLLSIADWKYFQKQEFYTEAMYEYIQGFVNYVYEHKNPNLKNWHSPERKVDLSRYIPESFGRIDEPLIAGDTLHIFDLKYGKGVEVSAENNSQLKIYALGMLDIIEDVFEVNKVVLHIYQPRMNNISTFEITVADLVKWGEEYLIPRAMLAFHGKGDFVPGAHCQFCRAQAVCKALAAFNNELAAARFEDHTLMNDDELMTIISNRKIFLSWIKAVSEYTLLEALKGKLWPGYKLVEGRTKRKYANPEAIEKELLSELRISNMHRPKELLNFEDMQKLIGKDNFEKHIEPYLITPRGKPTLVPEKDKRKVFADAATVFADGFKDDTEYDIYD